ncbi:MAG: hypothetical protein EHM93_06660 [Bacteroidales bacterium]|nr:MAG: hypothetical protein EHM93_06660 [Bacteroidales bacterium]
MKIYSALFTLLFVFGCQKKQSLQVTADSISPQRKHIILMHPTVSNIKTFKYLVENKIFPLPEDYKAIGVYHSLEEYNYMDTEDFIKQKGITNVVLVRIDAEFSANNIFKSNSCSDVFKTLFEKSNGAIFFGGPDIPPSCYEEQTSLLTTITDPYRHYMELSFLYHLLGGDQDSTYTPLLNIRPDYPILGICLGMQSINVATGGTLYQDIPSELYNQKTIEEVMNTQQNQQHRNYQTNYSLDAEVTYYFYHQIALENDSPLRTYVSSDTIHPYVWSSHHQCLKQLGQGIKVAARSMDGKIVESINHLKFPNVLGVQFHPEKKELYEPNDKIRISPLKPAEFSYIDLYSGDKGESFQRAIWREFASKFR